MSENWGALKVIPEERKNRSADLQKRYGPSLVNALQKS